MAEIINEKSLDLCYLEADQVRFHTNGSGVVRLTLKDCCSYPNVLVFRCFPLETKDQFISVRNGFDDADTEIGILADLNALDEQSRAIVHAALAKRYFVPEILAVRRIEELFGRFMWSVDTDRGPRELTVKDMNTNVRFLGSNRMLIIDADGCRYHIHDFQALDSTSLRYLTRYLLV